MIRVNPVIDELHDQLMALSMRAVQLAQKNAELEVALAAANRELQDWKGQQENEHDPKA